jgi:hypothetical protein
MSRPFPLLCVGVIILLVLLIAPSTFGEPDPVKASRKCRKAIASQTAKLVTTAQKLADKCHAGRVKGKLVADCNHLAAADPKGVLAKAEGGAAAKIDKACAPEEPVRINYPGGAVAAAITAGVRKAVEASAAALQGATDLTASKSSQKCHAAIGKARTSLVDAIVKAAIKCQAAADKKAVTFGPLAAACVSDGGRTAKKAAAKIAKACTPRGAPPLTGGDIGSCTPLPDCVVAQARVAGQALAALAYEKASACGDGFVDLARGEACPLPEDMPDQPRARRDARHGHRRRHPRQRDQSRRGRSRGRAHAARDRLRRDRHRRRGVRRADVARRRDRQHAEGRARLGRPHSRSGKPGRTRRHRRRPRGEPARSLCEPRHVRRQSPPSRKLPAGSADLPKIDHNLAVRAHAAWNARAALATAVRPIVVVGDFFGDGPPNGDVDREDTAGAPGTGALESHGYHVLGTVAATLEGPMTDRGLATGMYPRRAA